ncbi:DUF5677 domain-containing protein [Parasphingorhabdus sp.]|uniref:DUF5677 domain-containing protein n=1 Tax=Parasphingorhabdus sp. TaxID=2709688 RepID=UPI003A95C132
MERKNDLAIRVKEANELLFKLFERLPDMLTEHDEADRSFRDRCYERWENGLDLLKMFIVMSEEFGSAINDRERIIAVAKQDYKFEATIALHARGVRVANEILTLLREGFPDGALSRWRTLHEVGVVSTFLSTNEREASLRFLAHRGVVSAKALAQYQEYLPRSNMKPLRVGDLELAQGHRDQLIEKFGPEFKEEMGWAFPIIPKKKGINLFDLEKATGLDHWRPRFKWASDDIHVGAKPHFASLGMAETALDKPALLTGRSDSAFADPAHMCVISLNLANHSIPTDYRNKDDEIILVALRTLSDLLGETFLEIDRATRKKSPRAMQGENEQEN